jgi:hypothetical protein
MKVSQEELQWAGSNIIGIAPGGFLLVHNDVSLPPLDDLFLIVRSVQHLEQSAPPSECAPLPQRELAARVVSESLLSLLPADSLPSQGGQSGALGSQ